MGKSKKSKATEAIPAADTSATTPNPAETAYTSSNKAEDAPPAESKKIDFESYYLQQVTAEFADDLDNLRKASDFNEEFLPILIDALKGTAGVYSEEEKAKVMGKR
ncbi:MAG: hypothetical protein LQ343_001449 [Gyalolechia ehrenbergii]|nr:MAG: hypothetical protein LQ343_001449 [Gyalolechia ehrenbergii]